MSDLAAEEKRQPLPAESVVKGEGMRYAVKTSFLLLIAPLLMLGACDNGDTPTTPTPPQLITDTFSGTLTLNGGATHSFVTNTGGTVTATITGVVPATSPSFGFTLGTWNGTVCIANMTNELATTSAVLTGTVISASPLCVRVFDSQGTIPADNPINYTITVVHP
jgi:hypothetical protein